MKRLLTRALCALALLCALSTSALAIDVTIAGSSFSGYNYSGSTARLRIYPAETFVASDSAVVPGGTTPGSTTGFFTTVNCTVASATLTCPSVTLKSTTDSLDKPSVTYTVVLFDAAGTRRDFFPVSEFRLTHTFGANTTWAAVINDNAAARIYPPPGYPTTEQMNAAIAAQIGVGNPATTTALGRVKVSTAPADPTSPVAVETGDPRMLTSSQKSQVTEVISRTCLASQGCFDGNDAAYGAVAYQTTDPATTCASGTDSAAAIQAAMDAATTWAQANTGSVVVRLTPGVSCIKRDPPLVRNARAQIVLPELAMATRKVYLTLESKNPSSASPQPFQTPGAGANVMLYTTLTGQTYSGVTGTPCILGGPDAVNGTAHTDWTWMTFHVKNISLRAPQNPSVCGLNLTNVNHAVVENFRADVSGVSGLPADFGEPTNAHATAVLMPTTDKDGMDYRGSNMVAGWYGGFGISELTNSTGVLFSYRNKVGLVIQAPWYHVAHVKHAIVVGSPYAVAAVNPASGVTAVTGYAGTFRTHLTIDLLDIEDANSPTCAPAWAVPVAHVYDPTSSLGGVIKHFRVTGCVGNDVGVNSGLSWHARNIKFVDLVAPEHTPDVIYDRLFGVAGAALTLRRPQFNQGSAWELPGVSGAETYTNLVHFSSGGGVIGSAGAGVNQNVVESGTSDGTISMTGRFQASGSGSIGLLFRYASKDSYWMLEWSGTTNQVKLYKKTAADTYSTITTTAMTPAAGQYYTMVVVLSGNSVKAYVNGTQTTNITDAYNNSSTKHGLVGFGTNGHMTNFRVSVQ